MKPVVYCGSSASNIRGFDTKTKQRILRLLDMLCAELDLHPKDFKYMGVVGVGVYELRVRTDKQHRVFYVAKFEEAIYVLHAFVKKGQKTLRRDINIGMQRYKALINYRGVKNEAKT